MGLADHKGCKVDLEADRDIMAINRGIHTAVINTMADQEVVLEDHQALHMIVNLAGRRVGWCILLVGMGNIMVAVAVLEGQEATTEVLVLEDHTEVLVDREVMVVQVVREGKAEDRADLVGDGEWMA